VADGDGVGVAAGALRSEDIMNVADDPKLEFIAELRAAIDGGTFIKLSLSKFRGEGEPRKAVAALVMIKGKPQLKLVTSFQRKDDIKTFPIARGVEAIAVSIGAEFMSATLFTSTRDLRLDYSRKGIPHLASGKPTMAASAPQSHDRQKSYLVAPDRPYLKALGVADRDGRIKPTMQGKYRQICRFIEIAADLIPEGAFNPDRPLTAVDIGSGKGYLTFAFYDYVMTVLNRSCQMTGIEVRGDLVELCNDLARELDFHGLTFVAEEAARAASKSIDVVIALHACDTATDDAMAFGVQAGAGLILSAPCCQHELAPQIHDQKNGLKGLIKYPLLKQRQADLVTDAARALLLEASGYKVRLIEFVSTEHTSKNILIAATKSATVDRSAARQQFRELQETIGFSQQHLASQLKAAE
jgi:hypothetical protein